MRTTHDNVEIRIELVNEEIDKIVENMESRDNLKVDFIISSAKKLEYLSKKLSVLRSVYIPLSD